MAFVGTMSQFMQSYTELETECDLLRKENFEMERKLERIKSSLELEESHENILRDNYI